MSNLEELAEFITIYLEQKSNLGLNTREWSVIELYPGWKQMEILAITVKTCSNASRYFLSHNDRK